MPVVIIEYNEIIWIIKKKIYSHYRAKKIRWYRSILIRTNGIDWIDKIYSQEDREDNWEAVSVFNQD